MKRNPLPLEALEKIELLRKELISESSKYPSLFSNNNPERDEELKELIKAHEFDWIAGSNEYCEMWPIYILLEQAMEIGYFVGRYPEAYKTHTEKVKSILIQMDQIKKENK